VAQRCTVCDHPQRHEIDAELVADRTSYRAIARHHGLDRDAVRRHQANHLPLALVRAEEVRRDGGFAEAADTFQKAVSCLRLELDACDEWLTDPENPNRYTLEPRANEVTVVYLKPGEDGKDARTREDLQALLDRVEKRLNVNIVWREAKRADPRKLIVDVANSLDGKLGTFLNWLQAKQEQERENAKLAAAQDAGAELRDVIAEALPEERLKEIVTELLEEAGLGKVAPQVAAVLAPGLGPRIVAEFEETP
jgi:hypothetical protein